MKQWTISSIEALAARNRGKKMALVMHTSAVNFSPEILQSFKNLGFPIYFSHDVLWELYHLKKSTLQKFATNAAYLYDEINTRKNPFFYLSDFYSIKGSCAKNPEQLFKEDIVVFVFGTSSIAHEFIECVPGYDNVYVVSSNKVKDKKLEEPISLKDLKANWALYGRAIRTVKQNKEPRPVVKAKRPEDYSHLYLESLDGTNTTISASSLKTLNSSGNEACIYKSSEIAQNKLIKLYKKSSATEMKQLQLKYLRKLSDVQPLCRFLPLPKQLVLNERATSTDAAVVGFVMEDFSNENVIPLTKLINSNWGKLNPLDVVRKIILHVLELEQLQIYPTDLSAHNILVNKNTGEVYLIDCDSFEVYNAPSATYTRTWLHPELEKKDLNKTFRKPYQFHFSFACLMLQCFAGWDNPLNQIITDEQYFINTVEKHGYMWSEYKFAYDYMCKKNKNLHTDEKYADWKRIPAELQKAFSDEFHFKKRLSLGTWLHVIRESEKN